MASSKKQITFDLDTKALQEYYPKANWHNAYEDIKNQKKFCPHGEDENKENKE